MKLQRARGVRDLLPKEAIPRQAILDKLRKTFELYGFSPAETPILERYETLASKYAGGAEILKETFKLKDQGNRELGLRYDLTVPLCRLVGMNPQLKMPFKRYQIGPVFRDGPVNLGRYREFYQCDVDIIGSKSMLADAELLALSRDVFKDLKLKVKLNVNNIKLLNSILEYAGIKENKDSVLLTLDKLDKAGLEAVKSELKQKNIPESSIKKLIEIINLKGNNEVKLKKLKNALKDQSGLNEIQELSKYCKSFKVEFELNLWLARGLSYYTGTIFEIKLTGSEITSSVGGGGRYDKIIGNFLESNQEYPAVGISFGIERIYDAIKKDQAKQTVVQAFVIPIGVQEKAVPILQKLREADINAEMDLSDKGISKNLNYANALGIPFVIFVGEKELKAKKVKLKDMKSGKEELLALESAIKKIKKH